MWGTRGLWLARENRRSLHCATLRSGRQFFGRRTFRLLQHAALRGFDELDQVGYVFRLYAFLFELCDGLGRVQFGRLYQAVGVLDGAQAVPVKAAAFEPDFVEAVGAGLAFGRGKRIGQDVLGDGGASAGVGVLADAAELVDLVERAYRGVVLDDDVAGEGGGVGQDAVVADDGCRGRCGCRP